MSDTTEGFVEALEYRREQINRAIPEYLPVEHPDRLYKASQHLFQAGGKRLRPVVVLLVGESLVNDAGSFSSYHAFPDLHGESLDLMSAAVSIEIIHLFTLIHDDIMDQDDLRRGVPAVHRAYDMETAILAGDTLYSKAFEIILETGAPTDRLVSVMRRLASTCTKICEGQALDISFESRSDVSVDEYHEMIKYKTAVLYGAAASVPAILLGAPTETVEALYAYGIEVGKAFQIQDDVLDLTASSETLGKRRGSDLIEGKHTLITSYANQEGVDLDILRKPPEEITEDDIEVAVEKIRDAGGIAYAETAARDLVGSGKQQLSVLPDNSSRDHLIRIADYLIERDY